MTAVLAGLAHRWGYRLLFVVAGRLPYRSGYLLAWLSGWLGWFCDAPGRRRVACNLLPLLGGPPRAGLSRLVRRSYCHFTLTVCEQIRMRRIPPRYFQHPHLRIIDPWGVLPRLGSGAAILATTHCHWELLAAVLQQHSPLTRLAAIVLSHGDDEVDARFAAARAAVGVDTLLLDRAPLASLRWLRQGLPLGIVADRVYGGRGVPVRLCGQPIDFPIGPAALSLQCGAPVYPFHLARHSPTGLTLLCGRPLRPRSRRPKDEQVQIMLQDLADLFSRFLRASPHQWAAFGPVWSTTSAESLQ